MPATTGKSPGSPEYERESQIAVANAGFATFATAAGLGVREVSTSDLGSVDFVHLPPIQNAADFPTTMPIVVVVELLLSGESAARAVRPNHHQRWDVDFSAPRAAAWHAMAQRLGARRCGEFDGIRRESRSRLNRFFTDPAILGRVHWLAQVLLREGSLADERLYQEVSDGRCGALSADSQFRCSRLPRHDGDHRYNRDEQNAWDEQNGWNDERDGDQQRDIVGQFLHVEWRGIDLADMTTAKATSVRDR